MRKQRSPPPDGRERSPLPARSRPVQSAAKAHQLLRATLPQFPTGALPRPVLPALLRRSPALPGRRRAVPCHLSPAPSPGFLHRAYGQRRDRLGLLPLSLTWRALSPYPPEAPSPGTASRSPPHGYVPWLYLPVRAPPLPAGETRQRSSPCLRLPCRP